MSHSKQPRDVDMSPEAIDRRLRDVGQLYQLGLSLREAKYLGTVEELRDQGEMGTDPSDRERS